MTRIGPTDRLWVIGGAVSAVALLAFGWFFLIGPQLDQASNLHGQAADAQRRVAVLQSRLRELQQQNSRLPQYQAQLATDRQALPTSAASADFLRDLQAIGDRTGVAVTGVTVNAPVLLTGADAGTRALPMIVTVSGPTARLNAFLDQLQQGQPRAVLISTANLTPADPNGSPDGPYTLSLGLRAFVASGGTGNAQPSPKTS